MKLETLLTALKTPNVTEWIMIIGWSIFTGLGAVWLYNLFLFDCLK